MMDWSAATGWWVLAGVLVAVELTTGTFYLLMMAAGAAAAALAAHAGLGTSAQVLAAALVGGGATAAWHFKRARHPQSAPAASNRDVVLDIGETLNIEQWQADGTARAVYRGAAWAVRYSGDGAPSPGRHRIVALHGNELSVSRA
jgi:membrane protein implicated in regulation of membrane protease activity